MTVPASMNPSSPLASEGDGPPQPPAAAMLDELERVLASPSFAGASAHQRLLRHLVERTLAGETATLKESLLGIEVFQRSAASFDPRRDSIVRVEARRLRDRLHQHYATGVAGRWVISLPKGSYRPQWVLRPPQDDLQARAADLIERGGFLLRQGVAAADWRKALERFEAAAQLAPGAAAAHAGVARAHLQLVAYCVEPPQPGVGLALAAVHQALLLQPLQAEALVLAAQLTHRFDFNWPTARGLFQRARHAAPDSAYVHHALALSLMMRADFAGAQAELTQARRLDALSLSLRAHEGLLALYRRQWDEAEDLLQALLDISPDNLLGASLLAYVALCRGEPDSALVQYRAVAEKHPQHSIGACGQAWALAALGQQPAARRRLHELQQAWSGRYLSPYQLAMAEMLLGEPDTALTLLERALHERDGNLLCLPVDPACDSLRGQARFLALRSQLLGSFRGASGKTLPSGPPANPGAARTRSGPAPLV